MKLSLAQANEYGRRVLMAQGVPEDIARDVAEHLVESDRVGYTSHGLSILTNYRRVLSEGLAQADGRPELVNDRGAMLAYDGHHGLGQYVGKVVIEKAIERTQEHGQCIVTLRHSHHLGRMGHFGEMVAAKGLILLAFTNVINRAPTVAPFGGAQACLTTNPLCFAGPLPGGRPPFIVDMATSSIAVNKARVLAAKGEQAPPGRSSTPTATPRPIRTRCSRTRPAPCCPSAATRVMRWAWWRNCWPASCQAAAPSSPNTPATAWPRTTCSRCCWTRKWTSTPTGARWKSARSSTTCMRANRSRASRRCSIRANTKPATAP